MAKGLNEISSIADAIDAAMECSQVDSWSFDPLETAIAPYYKLPFGIWYRGQASADWDIMPSVFRPDSKGKYYDETSLFFHFQLRSPSFRSEHHSMFEWLCLMQHYDAPTRLLDWTESVLIALYFTVSDPEQERFDGALFALNARLLNLDSDIERRTGKRPGIHVPTSFNTVLRALMAGYRELSEIFYSRALDHLDETDSPEVTVLEELKQSALAGSFGWGVSADAKKFLEHMVKPVAVYPYRTNSRLLAQAGTFTIHGGKIYHTKDGYKNPYPAGPIVLNHRDSASFLKKYVIPRAAKQKLRRELEVAGIHKGTLFPELDKQSEYMRDVWRAE